MKFPCCSLGLVLLLISGSANARSAGSAVDDDLPRHGIIGLVVAAPDSSKPEDSQTNPPTVKNVVTGGAGGAAGIQTRTRSWNWTVSRSPLQPASRMQAAAIWRATRSELCFGAPGRKWRKRLS